MTLNPDRSYRTRDGREARLICQGRAHPVFTVVALVMRTDRKHEEVLRYTKDGYYNEGFSPSRNDLMAHTLNWHIPIFTIQGDPATLCEVREDGWWVAFMDSNSQWQVARFNRRGVSVEWPSHSLTNSRCCDGD